MYRDIPVKIKEVVEPIVVDHGCELVDAEIVERPPLLRVTVDRAAGNGSVPVDVCAEISRELGTHFDDADPLRGSYRLEVSSPGLHRTLAREKDFKAACGSTVKIKTRRPLAGRRRFHGRLKSFEDDLVQIEVDGQIAEIPFASVEKAHCVYEFSRADFNSRASQPVG